MRLASFVALATLMTGVALADTLPAGVVACLSMKHAQQYADYVQSAPDFAADMIDRANCYVNKEPVEVVRLSSKVKGYKQYKLLTGHKVWLPDGVIVSKTTK